MLCDQELDFDINLRDNLINQSINYLNIIFKDFIHMQDTNLFYIHKIDVTRPPLSSRYTIRQKLFPPSTSLIHHFHPTPS